MFCVIYRAGPRQHFLDGDAKMFVHVLVIFSCFVGLLPRCEPLLVSSRWLRSGGANVVSPDSARIRIVLQAEGSGKDSPESPQYYWDPRLYPKLNFNEDYYKVLEVKEGCSAAELKKAYYKLVFKYHPDNKTTEKEKDLANKQMMVINGAYRVLKDSKLRDEYNLQRQQGQPTNSKPTTPSNSRRYPHSPNVPYSTSSSSQPSSNFRYTSSSARASTHSTPSTAEVNFADFKEFVEDLYGRKFSDDAEILTSMYSRMMQDEAYRESVMRGADLGRKLHGNGNSVPKTAARSSNWDEDKRSNSYSQQKFTARSPASKAVDLPEIDVTNRGDGSLKSLYLYLNSLKRLKDRKEGALKSDGRDWGEVKDLKAINERLAAIDELKDIVLEIGTVESEIQMLEMRYGEFSESSREDRNSQWQFDEQSSGRKDHYRSARGIDEQRSPYESEPQPQRQREDYDDNGRRYRTGYWGDDDGEYGPSWREAQERRRRGGKMSASSSLSDAADLGETEEFLKSVFQFMEGRKSSESSRHNRWSGQGTSRENSSWTMEDLLSTRDMYRQIADEFENFDSRDDNGDESFEDELRRFMNGL